MHFVEGGARHLRHREQLLDLQEVAVLLAVVDDLYDLALAEADGEELFLRCFIEPQLVGAKAGEDDNSSSARTIGAIAYPG